MGLPRRMNMVTERFFDSAGVNPHYIDWGGVGRPMVLLAGLGDTAQLYRGWQSLAMTSASGICEVL